MRPPSEFIGAQIDPVVIQDIIRCLSNISFGDGSNRSEGQNLDLSYVSGVTNGVVDTETVHPHRLGRTPVGFIVVSLDKAGVIYNSNNAHTSTDLKIKCSVASVSFKVIIF